MEELVKALEYLRKHLIAVETGILHFVGSLPAITKNRFEIETKKKLHTTRDNYLESLQIRMEDTILVVEIDPANWLANAVETGADPFNLKEGLLNGKSAKMSQKGFRYARIPIGKHKDASPKTEKGQKYQESLNKFLQNSKFGLSTFNRKIGSEAVLEKQKAFSNDPLLSGLYRTRAHKSIDAFHSGKSRPKWQYVMFRTVSENPLSQSKWDHPGLAPANIFKDVEHWLSDNVDGLLNSFIDAELNSIGE